MARSTLLYLGQRRFGELPAEVWSKLESIESAETLQQRAARLFEVETWSELLNPQ